MVGALASQCEGPGSNFSWVFFCVEWHVLPCMSGFCLGTPASPHSPNPNMLCGSLEESKLSLYEDVVMCVALGESGDLSRVYLLLPNSS